MFNINSKLSATMVGLGIFFVPFFTYLSPENLKQLSKFGVAEILASLIVVLIIIFLSSYSIEKLIARFFKKEINLFPLICLAFYLNFFYTPFLNLIEKILYTKLSFIEPIAIMVFIFFELCCLFIIWLGAKFYNFSIRMIFIFSTLMLLNALIPLIDYLVKNIEKKPSISYEIISENLRQDVVKKKRNIYYVILDEMVPIEIAEKFNISSEEEVLGSLLNTGLRYINKSQSSYSKTNMTMTSIMLLDYHQKPSSKKFLNQRAFFPHMMYKMQSNVPLISYLSNANSSFFWTAGEKYSCRPSDYWTCLNLPNDFLSNNFYNFSSTTPLPKILQRIFNNIRTQDSISPFLEYLDKKGLPKNTFFAYIHHNSPHAPFLLTSDCSPTNFINQPFEGYKASYKCALKTIQIFMEKINSKDPEAIVIFQGDHGFIANSKLDLKLTKKEKYMVGAKIFNAIKAPEICFKEYGLPRTTVNTVRFALNCAYGYKLSYRNNIHYQAYGVEKPEYGTVVERIIYKY